MTHLIVVLIAFFFTTGAAWSRGFMINLTGSRDEIMSFIQSKFSLNISAAVRSLFTISILFGVLMQVVFASEGTGRSDEVTLLEQRISLPMPKNYCELGDHPADVNAINDTRDRLRAATKLQLVSLFAVCEELREFRKGKISHLSNFGSVDLQIPQGSNRNPFKGISKEKYLSGLQEAMAKISPEQWREVDKKINSLGTGMRQERLNGLGADENGFYSGMINSSIDPKNANFKQLNISTMTLIKGLPFIVYFYSPYKSKQDVERLLNQSKTYAAELARANK